MPSKYLFDLRQEMVAGGLRRRSCGVPAGASPPGDQGSTRRRLHAEGVKTRRALWNHCAEKREWGPPGKVQPGARGVKTRHGLWIPCQEKMEWGPPGKVWVQEPSSAAAKSP